MKRVTLVFIVLLLVGTALLFGQSEGDWRTRASGNWTATNVWQKYESGAWVDKTTNPSGTSTSNAVTISAGHSVNLNNSRSIGKIDVYGALTVNTGRTLTTEIIDVNPGQSTSPVGKLSLSGTGKIAFGSAGEIKIHPYGEFAASSGGLITGIGKFTLLANAVFDTKNPDGIYLFDEIDGTFGTIQCTNTDEDMTDVSLSTSAHYTFSSPEDSQVANGLPATVKSLIVNIAEPGDPIIEHELELVGDVTITEKLKYLAGDINTGDFGISYTSGATLEYAGLYFTQLTDNGCFPASDGPTHLVIDNERGVVLHATRTIPGDMLLADGEFDLEGNVLTVNGTTTKMPTGSITDRDLYTDGYIEPAKFISFAETNNSGYLKNITVTTSVDQQISGVVKRKWVVSVDSMGTKVVTINWSADEDGTREWEEGTYPTFTWTASKGSKANLSYESFDAGPPREYVGSAPSSEEGGDFLIQNNGIYEGTLPVEFSNFTASVTSQGLVRVMWTTSSETNVQGFYLYRSQIEEVETAELISPMISATNTSTTQVYIYNDSSLTTDGTYYYWLLNVNMDNSESFYGPVSFVYNANGSSGNQVVPVVQGISKLYPNPFNPNVSIQYGITNDTDVTISVYNSKGQRVFVSKPGRKSVGFHTFVWDGKDTHGTACPSGVYLFSMNAGKRTYTTRATLMK